MYRFLPNRIISENYQKEEEDMWRYMARNKARFVLLIVLLIANGITVVNFALVMGRLMDCAVGNGQELLAALASNIIYLVFSTLLLAFYSWTEAAVIADARGSLKKDVFMGIMGKSVADFDSAGSGEYINELSNNVNMLESVYFRNIIQAMQSLVAFLSATVICISIQPQILVLMLLLALVTLGVTKFTAASMEKTSENFARCSQEYMQDLQDAFGGFRLILSFGIMKAILKKHDLKNVSMEQAKRKNRNQLILCSCMGLFTGFFSTVVIMAATVWFCLQGMLSVGMVIAFGQLIGKIINPVTELPAIIANFRTARPLQARMEKLMDGNRKSGTETLPGIKDGITLEQLSFRYQEDKEVLQELSFRFENGRHYAIVGSSGSGKSTMLSLLSGYYPDYEGRILLDQTELRQLSEKSRCSLVGVVSQDAFLFNDTLQNNITLFEDCPRQMLDKAIEDAGLKEFVDTLPAGLQTMVEESGKNFSGGEKQRISLARVILRRSSVLLLDEFTANLDERTAKEIEQRILARKDSLVITVTHRLNQEILRQYDRILVLSQGKLAASGTYEELQQKKALPVSGL